MTYHYARDQWAKAWRCMVSALPTTFAALSLAQLGGCMASTTSDEGEDQTGSMTSALDAAAAQNPFCQSSERFTVWRGARVTTTDGSPAVTSSGSGQTLIDTSAQVNSVLSVGAVRVNSSATVTGSITSSSSVTLDPTARVTGTVSQFVPVSLPPLPSLPTFPPPTGSDRSIGAGMTLVLAPGSYPNVYVNSGGTLKLSAGSYYFRTLLITSASRVEAVPGTKVYVQNSFSYQSSFVTSAGALQPVFLGYAGSTAIRMEAAFDGTVLAPAAQVSFGVGAGLSFHGTFQARIIEVNPQSSLQCIQGPS